MKRHEKFRGRSNSSLAAVALQDHIAREYGLITDKPTTDKPTRTHQLTLAQRLGLVAGPAPPLTNSQWDKAKEASSRRGDSAQPCPICHEVFGLQKQVLLSCTHTFHKSCLLAFERYSGKKSCPICRTKKYESKLINSGSKHYKHTAAIKIQSVWRGYTVRKWLEEYRERHPPHHPILRAKHYRKKLTCLTTELVESVNSTTEKANNLLATVDYDLEESRKAMRCFEEQQLLEPDWDNIIIKASQYITTDCVICLAPLSLPRPLTVLSCSHLYHQTCITSLESFTNDTTLHSCPTCRTPYTSKDYTVHKQ